MALGMGIGMGTLSFESIDNFWQWVELCEDSQLDSIWQSDRLLSQQPFIESMTMMAALAGATRRIKFGMNSVVLGFRHPLLLAKQCASIDYLSNGRLLPSFGIGGKEAPEWQGAGFIAKQRGKAANEALEIMARLWRDDNVDYEGDFFQLQGASISPKPVQKHLPMWIGGASQAAVQRTARYGTGWIAGLQAPDTVAKTVADIKVALEIEQRQIAEDHYGATIIYRFQKGGNKAEHPFANAPGADKIMAIGGLSAITDLIGKYIDAGVSKFVAIPLAESDEEIVVQTQQLIDEVLPLIYGN